MLAHRQDGTCVYLGTDGSGCSIQHDKPLMCQRMDCRVIAEKLTFTLARKARTSMQVWRKGKELLRQQKAAAR